MKNYLLKPHKRLSLSKGDIWLVSAQGLRECWKFIKEKFFLCIHFIYDSNLILRTINSEHLVNTQSIQDFIYNSDVQLGFLTKRGKGSVKSIAKVYRLEEATPLADYPNRIGCPDAQIQGINTSALLLRLEMYVDEARWKDVNEDTKSILNSFIQKAEELIVPTLEVWNQYRSGVTPRGSSELDS